MRLVAIGGSAGSLEAIRDLLSAIPANTRAVFTVVVHILPTNESLLSTVIASYTSMPVQEAVDKLPLAAGRVVVAPPDYHMLIEQDHTIALSRDPAEHFSRPAIDPLFESAAHAMGAAAIGVLLSGSNHDGAAGLAALARAGGVVCVQDPASAQAPEMPTAGIAACAPDLVAVPAEIGRWVAAQLGGGR